MLLETENTPQYISLAQMGASFVMEVLIKRLSTSHMEPWRCSTWALPVEVPTRRREQSQDSGWNLDEIRIGHHVVLGREEEMGAT